MKKHVTHIGILFLMAVSFFGCSVPPTSTPPEPTTPPQNTNQQGQKPAETMVVKAYFSNVGLDPNKEFECQNVFAVERTIPKTESVALASVTELLKGPTVAEKAQGYTTNINPGVKVQKLTIEDGVAKVDFDKQLEHQVGGSCRVTAIVAQITQTLKQFPTVKDVVISIDGRTEDILQP